MRKRKERLTVTVDPDLVQAANEAVAAGRADSLSSWVSLALAERVEKERQLRAMAEAITAYEAEFGLLSAEELLAQEHADRASAVVVRGGNRTRRHRRAVP